MGCEDRSGFPGLPLPVMADATAAPSVTSPLRRQPRQARSQERVRRILAAAEELFVAGGVGSTTTTNAIAARAGVPIGSLYQFFPDKGAILRSLAQLYAEQLHELLTAFFDRGDGRCLSLEASITAAVASPIASSATTPATRPSSWMCRPPPPSCWPSRRRPTSG